MMKTKCLVCGTEMQSKRENVKYDASGLDGITLKEVLVHRCPNCGESEIEIQGLAELHRRIALAVARRAERLGPKEIRFLRKYLGLSSKDFANKMGVDKTTVSKWERVDNPTPMGQPTERLLRLMVMIERPVEEYPLEETATKEPRQLRMTVESNQNGWHAVFA